MVQRRLDVRYEELVREPEKVMRGVCEFLGEDFEEGMFEFYKTDMCKARGASRDHAPLGKPISDTKRYQMLGNSVAVPCVAYILQSMARQLALPPGKEAA